MIRAAGGIVWRRTTERRVEVLLVHRPRYDDWTFPKGKLDPGEGWEDAARREVEEESGFRCALGLELPSTRYEDRHGRPKVVRYWAMQVIGGEFSPNDEVDAVLWCAPEQAAGRLTHQHDVEVLAGLAAAIAAAV